MTEPAKSRPEARSKGESSHIADSAADIGDKVGRGYFELKTADARADVDSLEIQGSRMEISRKGLLHAHRRASAADIAGDAQKILHRDHLDLLVARKLREGLEIDLAVSRNDAYKVARPVAVQHQSLENPLDRLSQTVSYMLSRQVVLIKFIRNEPIRNLRPIQKPGRIGLFYLLRHNGCKSRDFSDIYHYIYADNLI